jgi:hypothetical protein
MASLVMAIIALTSLAIPSHTHKSSVRLLQESFYFVIITPMSTYDFFIAGRWRNYPEVKKALDTVRSHNKTAYCFIENSYEDSKVEFKQDASIESIMQKLESLPKDDDFIKHIFENDMQAQRDSDALLLVLPAGISGHIEAGASYGMGKKCYAVGVPEKTETLYDIFDEIFSDIDSLKDWLKAN